MYSGTQVGIRVNSYSRLNLLEASFLNFKHLEYYGTQSDIRVKSYCRLNLLRASAFKSESLYILRYSIRHLRLKLLSFEFVQCFCFQFRASRYTTGHNRTPELKVIVV